MNQTIPLLTMPVDPETGLLFVQDTLQAAGFDAYRSFDFRDASATYMGCQCPRHGTELCTCQMIVLFVYGQGSAPATLVIHGREGITHFALVDVPGGRPDGALAASLLDIFQERGLKNRLHRQGSHAT